MTNSLVMLQNFLVFTYSPNILLIQDIFQEYSWNTNVLSIVGQLFQPTSIRYYLEDKLKDYWLDALHLEL